MFETLATVLNDLFGMQPTSRPTVTTSTPHAERCSPRPAGRPKEDKPESRFMRFIRLGLAAIRYTDAKGSRQALKGVLVRKGKMYATDGHKAFIASVTLPPGLDNIIFPPDFFKMHRNLPIQTLELTPDKRRLLVNGRVFPTPLIDEPYPNIEGVIPEKFRYEAIVDKERLVTAVALAIKGCNDRDANITIDTRQRGRFSIFANHRSGDAHLVRHEVPYAGSCMGESFAFNGVLLLNIMKDLPGGTVRVRMNNHLGAFVFQGQDEGVKTLLMPVRIHADEQALRQAA